MKGVKACLHVKAPKGEGALAKSFEVREGDCRVGAEAQLPNIGRLSDFLDDFIMKRD